LSIIEPTLWKRAMGGFPSGVTVVTTQTDGRAAGTAVNAFTAVSMSPSLLLICLAHDSRTLLEIRRTGVFGVNILAQHHADLAMRFASKVETDRFAGVALTSAITGAPLLGDAVAWFDCEVESLVTAGDHEVVTGRVLAAHAADEAAPLLYHRGRLGPLQPVAEPIGG
jgi:3-hydroxy-9,10-secoandrosta-1,3,5(10)-triene-9,17-dione monooxygenase reductase component